MMSTGPGFLTSCYKWYVSKQFRGDVSKVDVSLMPYATAFGREAGFFNDALISRSWLSWDGMFFMWIGDHFSKATAAGCLVLILAILFLLLKVKKTRGNVLPLHNH